MKKKYLFLFVLICIFLMPDVKAIYNGASGGGLTQGNSECDKKREENCLWNVKYTRAIQITLYYFDANGTRTQIGNQIYATDRINNFKNYAFAGTNFYEGLIYDNNLGNGGKDGKGKGNGDLFDAEHLNKYLMKEDVFRRYVEEYIGVKLNSLNLPSDPAPKPDGRGYRLLLEPMVTVQQKGYIYLKTTKEIAEGDITAWWTTKWTKIKNLSLLMYVVNADVGITPGNSKGPTKTDADPYALNIIKDPTTGWGYNIIDISNQISDACVWTNATSCCAVEKSSPNYNEATLKKEHPACFPVEPKPEPKPEPTCDYSLDLSIPNNCKTSTTGSIDDINDWNCIFQSTTEKQSKGDVRVQNHFYEWENSYCAVYCRESVSYTYPNNSMTVLAGTHFVLGNVQISNGPSNFTLPRLLENINFTSSTECRVTKEKGNYTNQTINYEKFKQDYEKANNNVKIAWDNWKAAIAKGNVTNQQSLYEQAVKNRDSILDDIKACNNFVMKNDNFNPQISFEYEEPIYGRVINSLNNDDLSINIKTDYYDSQNKFITSKTVEDINFSNYNSIEGYSDFVVTAENKGNTSEVDYWECNSNSCTKIKKQYPSNSWLKQYTIKSYNYTLPSGIYQYVSKSSGESYDSKSLAGGDENVIYISYSNLPVHISTQTDAYNYSLDIKTFGTTGIAQKHKFDYYIFNDAETIQSFGGTTRYKCTYNVKNSFTEPENPLEPEPLGGINIIFRPISLDNPFPSIDADGREPGANWNATDEEGNKISVEAYITNNRNVQTEKIYKELDPLYKITLTPALIKEIREYNDKQDLKIISYISAKGTKQGNAGYADFELTCDDNGRNCKSEFIRGIVSGYNFSQHFTGCGIQNKASGLKCSTNDSW